MRFHSSLARVLLLCLVLGSTPARAQEEFSLGDLALDWAQGRFATPLICRFDGKPVRGLRRIRILPGPAHVRPRVAKITFVDLEVDDASRCFTELGGDTPNIVGSLQIRLLGNRRGDTVRRDFRAQLHRKRGFDFDIVAGGLKIRPVTQPASAVRGLDFRGGRASLHELEPGSDRGRLLASFDSPRKLLLELAARDGTKFSFPLYMTDPL